MLTCLPLYLSDTASSRRPRATPILQDLQRFHLSSNQSHLLFAICRVNGKPSIINQISQSQTYTLITDRLILKCHNTERKKIGYGKWIFPTSVQDHVTEREIIFSMCMLNILALIMHYQMVKALSSVNLLKKERKGKKQEWKYHSSVIEYVPGIQV